MRCGRECDKRNRADVKVRLDKVMYLLAKNRRVVSDARRDERKRCRRQKGSKQEEVGRLGGGKGSGLGRALPVAVAFGHANSAFLPHVSAYSQSGLSMATQAPGSLDQTLFGSGKGARASNVPWSLR